jgi:hypothetical protein
MEFIAKSGLFNGERLLEYKTLNRHAAIYWPTIDPVNSSSVLFPGQIRNRVNEITKPNMFRGLAFGVIISAANLPENVDDFFEAIDIRQKERSVWQWTIFRIEEPRIVIGLHTWMQVWLSSAYENCLNDLQSEGFSVERFTRKKGKLMKILTALQPHYEFPEHKAPNN